MQFQQLTYFVAVAETRHFTHAADRCHVAQPSLSKQIASLERELGAVLFSRARGNITLTAAGEALLPLARRILADAATARLEIAELVGMKRGRVRLGATPSVCGGLLGRPLARFHERYPGIELILQEGGSRDLVSQLAGGQLDLALVILPLHGGDTSLVTTPILHDHLVVASPAALPPPTPGPYLAIEELREHELVMFRRGYDLREATVDACRHAGFEPRFAVEGGEMDAVLRFVEAGLGVAVVPAMVLSGQAGLTGTPLAPPGLHRTIAIARRRDVTPTRAARAFQSAFTDFLHESDRQGELPAGLEVLAAAPLEPPHEARDDRGDVLPSA